MNKKKAPDNIQDPVLRDAMKGVTPIKYDRMEPFRRRLRPRPLYQHGFYSVEATDKLSEQVFESDVETGEELYFARPGIQHRLMRDLGRGRIEIQETLDLHGMTVAYARVELVGFLSFCQRHHIRCVHIIHGKGYGSENRQPILKQKLNLWLRQHGDVLGFCSAHRRDGGTGAVYVLLRNQFRQRP